MYIIFVVCERVSAYLVGGLNTACITYWPWCVCLVRLLSPLFVVGGLGFVVEQRGGLVGFAQCGGRAMRRST